MTTIKQHHFKLTSNLAKLNKERIKEDLSSAKVQSHTVNASGETSSKTYSFKDKLDLDFLVV